MDDPNLSPWRLLARDATAVDATELESDRTPVENPMRSMLQCYVQAAEHLHQLVTRIKRTPVREVYLDLDGVLTNFNKAALARHDYHGPMEGKLTPGEWHIEKCLGVSIKEFWAKLGGTDFWLWMEWMPDGREIFDAVQGLCNRLALPLRFLSSPSLDPCCHFGKAAWMQREVFNGVGRLDLMNGKHRMSGPGRLLIDDSDKNCDLWREEGGVAVLVPRLWNGRHFAATALPGGVANLVKDEAERLMLCHRATR